MRFFKGRFIVEEQNLVSPSCLHICFLTIHEFQNIIVISHTLDFVDLVPVTFFNFQKLMNGYCFNMIEKIRQNYRSFLMHSNKFEGYMESWETYWNCYVNVEGNYFEGDLVCFTVKFPKTIR